MTKKEFKNIKVWYEENQKKKPFSGYLITYKEHSPTENLESKFYYHLEEFIMNEDSITFWSTINHKRTKNTIQRKIIQKITIYGYNN